MSYREQLIAGKLTLEDVQECLLESASSAQRLVGFALNNPDLDQIFEAETTRFTNIAVGGELVLVQYVLSDAKAAASMWRISCYSNGPEDEKLFYRTYAEKAFDFVERELQRMFPGTIDNISEIRKNAFVVPSRDLG